MAKKKHTNKRKHNKKIQHKVIIQNRQQITQQVSEVNEYKKNCENYTQINKSKEKGKETKTSRKYLVTTFFFLLGLLILFILGYNKNEKTYETNTNIKLPDVINEQELSIVNMFIKEDNYIPDNLSKYLKYYYEYNISTNHIIIIVNNNLENLEYNEDISNIIEHSDFIEENFIRYIEYYNKYKLSIDKTILAVNNNLDKDDIKLDKTVENFMKQKYFISDNLKRYLNYYKKYNNLSYKEIITRVNSNLDKTFYKNINKADTSKGNLILVNKYYYLNDNYEPSNLVDISSKHGTGKLKKEAYDAFKKMYADAKDEGLYLYIASPYRSYDRQKTLYTNYVTIDGTKEADKYSARPGYSEHQTGLAFDLGTASNHSINDFSSSNEFKWVKKNAHKYGFILRYPYGKTYITGYIYEPWHYRYVGVDVATYIYKNNITYEEYYAYFVK